MKNINNRCNMYVNVIAYVINKYRWLLLVFVSQSHVRAHLLLRTIVRNDYSIGWNLSLFFLLFMSIESRACWFCNVFSDKAGQRRKQGDTCQVVFSSLERTLLSQLRELTASYAEITRNVTQATLLASENTHVCVRFIMRRMR